MSSQQSLKIVLNVCKKLFFVLYMHLKVEFFVFQYIAEYEARKLQQSSNHSANITLVAHFHVVSTLRCKGFRHFDGSRAPKCSSHPCFDVMLPRVSRLLQLCLAHQEGSSLNVASDITVLGGRALIIR